MCDVGGHLVAVWMRLVGHAFELPNALSPNEAGSLSILKEAPCMCDIGVNLWLCGCAWLVMLCAFQCLRSPQTLERSDQCSAGLL